MNEKIDTFVEDHPIMTYTMIFAVSLAVGSFLFGLRGEEPQEWCLVTTIDGKGGYFGSNGPGEDTYRIIQTRDGIEVYQKCSKQ